MDAGSSLTRIIAVAGSAAAASVVGGLIALLGWFLLRDAGRTVLSFLFATGAGGMFYLTITELVPESEKRQYQESAALSIMAGFVLIFIVAQLT
jgi:ZIP family zinc transporter